MKEIKNRTLLVFDEVNALAKTELSKDDVESLLINAYKLGHQNTLDMLHYETPIDVEDMFEAIYVIIEDKTWEDRYEDHLRENDKGGMKNLINSEFHRVYAKGGEDGANKVSRSTGKGVDKTWETMLDNKVRQTHEYLEGMTIPLEQEFYTFDGDHAHAPGLFSNVENNAGCRCILTYTFR